MESEEQKHLNTEWNMVIHRVFYEAWQRNSPVDITNYTYKIRHHFNLDRIVKRLVFYIIASDDRERDIKYHTNRLKILADAFVIALLQVSDDGKMLTSHNIEHAKHILSEKNPCDYEL